MKIISHKNLNGAKLENGLLTISLEQVIPEEKKPKLIEIK